MPPTLAFFIGNKSAFSVRRLLKNLTWMLKDDFELHLVTSYQDSIPIETADFGQIFQGTKKQLLHPYRSEYASLDEYLNSLTPDAVVQLTEPPRLGAITSLVARKHGVPFVYRYSGDRFIMYKHQENPIAAVKSYFIGNIIGRLPLHLANYHVVLGPTGQRRLSERGVSDKTIHGLPVAINVSEFSTVPDERLPIDETIPADRAVILFVGRLSEMKGIDTIERAIPRVVDKRENMHFLFVGPGTPPKVPQKYRENVTAVGPVDPESMPAYYHRSDLLAHPSHVEGTPRVIMEALAAGTPVLARDVGDVETITQNTFEDDDEFCSKLVAFEKLPLEDISHFSRAALKEKYIQSFTQICEGNLVET